MKSVKFNPLTSLVMAAALAIGLAACGGSSTTPDPMPPDPTPYEMAMDGIEKAESAEDAQAAYDAVKDDVTAAQGVRLQAAVDARVEALAMMDRAAEQKMALTTAAGNIDTSDLSTQAAVNAAETAIAALEAALAAAADVSDADKAMYQGRVTAAETAVASAQSALDHTAQTMVLSDAVSALQDIDLSDLSDEAKVDAAQAAIDAVQAALDAATELSAGEKAEAMTLVATANRTVMTVQDRMDVAGQTMALADAHGALGAIDLDNLMTQEQINAANAAIDALDSALDAAADLTDAQKRDALTDVTVAKRKVMAAETALAENVGSQRMALTMAGTALAAIDLADLDTAEKIAAANEAIDALEMALADATHLSDAAKAMYQTQLDTATETVRVAQTGMDRDGRMMAQRTAIMNAVTMARTAVAGVSDTSTDSEVASADAAVQAVKDAIAAAADLSEDDVEIISARAVLDTIEPNLAAAKTSRTEYLAKKGDEDAKTMRATGKALHAALAGSAVTNTTALDNATTVEWTGAGLTITPAAGAGANANTVTLGPVTFGDGDSVGALGSWNGMDFSDSEGTGDAMVTTEARVYTNQRAATSKPFADSLPAAVTPDSDTGAINVITDGTFNPDLGTGAINNVMAAAFEHSGEQNHTIPEGRTWFAVRGTYDGAPGEYRCIMATCSSKNDGSGSPSELGGTWTFTPDAGAMVSQPDAHYLYYGWWVSNGSDGMPTAASAFAGRFGTDDSTEDGLDPAGNLSELTGRATYVGNAAGKFAIDNVLAGTGNGGHFTADAELNAKFSGTDAGVTGTIDNFRLNDVSEDPDWSVSLMNGGLSAAGVIEAATGDDAMSTVWSIDGNKAAASGTWSGMMYDEMPGNRPDGDGSNIPTTATGTFYSEFSTIGRMVGAFGVNKQ